MQSIDPWSLYSILWLWWNTHNSSWRSARCQFEWLLFILSGKLNNFDVAACGSIRSTEVLAFKLPHICAQYKGHMAQYLDFSGPQNNKCCGTNGSPPFTWLSIHLYLSSKGTIQDYPNQDEFWSTFMVVTWHKLDPVTHHIRIMEGCFTCRSRKVRVGVGWSYSWCRADNPGKMWWPARSMRTMWQISHRMQMGEWVGNRETDDNNSWC
jgi:hypothetical protein